MPQALLSVYDKTGIVDFARALRDLGWTLIASGGTANALLNEGVDVTEVADYTGSPELLGGRVKTLHPAIHGGILARNIDPDLDELQALGWGMIGLVAVNLYPFEQQIAKAEGGSEDFVESIDIGGVALVRAAAKNFQRVTLVCDPDDYPAVLGELKQGGVSAGTRRRMSGKGFALTTRYDAAIADHVIGSVNHTISPLHINVYRVQKLRYGENPHQTANFYAWEPDGSPMGGKLLQGKELSYNNLLDLDAAWRAVLSFNKPTVCILKHLSPCGIASADDLVSAYHAAFGSDPVSAFGGVIATNVPFDTGAAEALGDLFVECIACPGFTSEARRVLASRSNCRLVEIPDIDIAATYEMRTINGGFLRQDIDMGDPLSQSEKEWKVISRRQPTQPEWVSLRFAWKACQHVKSNAIVLVQGEATVGIGGGQPNRVDCLHIAAQRAGDRARGSVMASDAFFPFADTVKVATKLGVTAIVQPGGSIRDKDSVSAADAADVAMVATGVRHFRH